MALVCIWKLLIKQVTGDWTEMVKKIKVFSLLVQLQLERTWWFFENLSFGLGSELCLKIRVTLSLSLIPLSSLSS